ncbi:hypothetical protein U1Q18_000652 [Sarracenia purpurea var. burkii]
MGGHRGALCRPKVDESGGIRNRTPQRVVCEIEDSELVEMSQGVRREGSSEDETSKHEPHKSGFHALLVRWWWRPGGVVGGVDQVLTSLGA